jgi:hypothetical protein
MYVYTNVHTCYVLTKPPIPSSRCKHYVFLRPVEILIPMYVCMYVCMGGWVGGWVCVYIYSAVYIQRCVTKFVFGKKTHGTENSG